MPGKAFEIVLEHRGAGHHRVVGHDRVCASCGLQVAQAGTLQRPRFRMPFTPYSGYLTLVFLVIVVVLMACRRTIGTWTVASLVVIVPALFGGWFLVRKRVLEAAGHW